MKIGIKYCGGCNPRYQREAEVEKLKKKLPDCTFTYDSSAVCNVWIAVHGCPSACAHKEMLKAKDGILEAVKARDFVQIAKKIQEKLEEKKEQGEGCRPEEKWTDDGRRILKTGQKASCTKTIDEEGITAFARVTGDFNKLHTDEEFARKTIYRRPVAHGLLTASLISTVMGTKMPGPGTVMAEIDFQFLMPVYPGDTIRAEVVFESVREHPNHYEGFFRGTCVNQDGVEVVAGSCRQILPKKMFAVYTTTEEGEIEK